MLHAAHFFPFLIKIKFNKINKNIILNFSIIKSYNLKFILDTGNLWGLVWLFVFKISKSIDLKFIYKLARKNFNRRFNKRMIIFMDSYHLDDLLNIWASLKVLNKILYGQLRIIFNLSNTSSLILKFSMYSDIPFWYKESFFSWFINCKYP